MNTDQHVAWEERFDSTLRDNEALARKVRVLAWELYCKETKTDMDVRDYWEELPPATQKIYLDKAYKEVTP